MPEKPPKEAPYQGVYSPFKRPPPKHVMSPSDNGWETIPNPEPPPDLAELELYEGASDVITRYERDFFRERWFGSPSGLLHFAWEAVKTLDEHDVDTPIKALPREAYLLDHFQNLLREDTYIVLKSRQIMITWATFIYLVWECLRRPYCKIGLVPKKSDDGKDHIEDRIHNFVWGHLPQWLRDDYPEPDLSRGTFHLKYKRGHKEPLWTSWIASFEKGPHQLRQYTLSHIFWDEMAFQEHARKAWQAAIPTIGRRGKGAGGRVISVSTMFPGSFHDVLCGGVDTVDHAVEIALGNLKPPPSGFYKNPQPGVVHYRNHKYGAFVAVYSFLADSEKRDPLWEQAESLKLGGRDSPEWLLDYRMQRQAFRGVLVYPHYDRRWNVVPAREVNRECEIFVSIDFGHTVPTAVGVWEWNEQTAQITGFAEIYMTTTSVGSIRAMLKFELAARLNLAVEDVIFQEVLGDNVADPEAPGTMLEYAQDTNPLHLRGNPATDAGMKKWKINDRDTSEARLDSALRPSFVHCGVRQYALDGEVHGICQGIIVSDAGERQTCGVRCPARPMLVMMEGRMPNLERELPLQQRIDVNDPGLEAPERNKKGIPNHMVDAARYAVMRYQSFFGIEAKGEQIPRFRRLDPSRLTTIEGFWREKYEMERKAIETTQTFDEAGEIGYPDGDWSEDDVYAD